ncbi:MAG TPA: polyprenyl synthetase family protein [Candidatus Nanoarchaeia archaeon]|nr:polyprenyl synthetase family protein [Candidatus Nanoarchaeia archaeon]
MPSNQDTENISNLYGAEKIISKIIKICDNSVSQIDIPSEIKDLISYNLRITSKRIRLLKMILIARITGGITKNILRVMTALEFANSAIFIHDDIIDHDLRRKGKETLNSLLGYEKALLLGNILHSLAICELNKIQCEAEVKTKIISNFSDSLLIEHIGQYSDLYYRWNFNNSLEVWEQMVLRHSGGYVISALQGIAILNKAKEDVLVAISDYERNCALAGAAEDSLLGVYGKKEAGDLKNGSFTILSCLVANFSKKSCQKNEKSLKKFIEENNVSDKVRNYIKIKSDLAITALNNLEDTKEKEALVLLAKRVIDNT